MLLLSAKGLIANAFFYVSDNFNIGNIDSLIRIGITLNCFVAKSTKSDLYRFFFS